MKQMTKKTCKKLIPIIITVLIGALGGYMYYRFVGCATGTCSITSNPYISTAYGAIMGGLIGSLFVTRTCGTCAIKHEKDHYE